MLNMKQTLEDTGQTLEQYFEGVKNSSPDQKIAESIKNERNTWAIVLKVLKPFLSIKNTSGGLPKEKILSLIYDVALGSHGRFDAQFRISPELRELYFQGKYGEQLKSWFEERMQYWR